MSTRLSPPGGPHLLSDVLHDLLRKVNILKNLIINRAKYVQLIRFISQSRVTKDPVCKKLRRGGYSFEIYHLMISLIRER